MDQNYLIVYPVLSLCPKIMAKIVDGRYLHGKYRHVMCYNINTKSKVIGTFMKNKIQIAQTLMMLSYIRYLLIKYTKNIQLFSTIKMARKIHGWSSFGFFYIFSAPPNSKNLAFLKHHFASINFLNESKLFSQKWSKTISKLIVASTLIKRNFP